MGKLDKYFLIQIIKTYLTTLISVVGVFMIFHFLEELDNSYPLSEKLSYIIHVIPVAVNTSYSIALFISTVIVIGQFNSNHEMPIFFSGGKSVKQIIKKVLFFVFLLSIFSLAIGEIFSPYFAERSLQIKTIASGKIFNNTNENIWIKDNNRILNIGNAINSKLYENVTIFELNEEKNFEKITFSKIANFEDDALNIDDATETNIVHKGSSFNILRTNISNSNPRKVILDSEQIQSMKKEVRTMTLIELFELTTFLGASGINFDDYLLELTERILKPINVIALVIISTPLLVGFDRGNSIGNMIFIAISFTLIFNLISKIIKSMAIQVDLNIFLVSILPTLIVTALALIIFLRNFRYL